MVDARDPGARLKALMHAGQELTDQGRRVTDWHFLYGLEQRKCTCKWVRVRFLPLRPRLRPLSLLSTYMFAFLPTIFPAASEIHVKRPGRRHITL
jgi:hypothetical protein